MLKHDKYWNWGVSKGDKVRSIVSNDKFKINEIYEVVIPQCTPSGIYVKDLNGKEIYGEHEWFEEIID